MSTQPSPSPILPIADVATTHTGALALPRNAATLVVTVTGGGSGSEWTAATFTATVDGSSVANVEESPADANTGVFTIPMNDAIAKTLVFTADNTPAGNTDQASTYTITLNYAAANTSDTGSGGTAIDLDLDGTDANVVLMDGPDDQTTAGPLQVQLNQNIVIKLPKFTVPDEIDAEDVSVNAFNPSDVSVSGTTLTLRMGNTGTATTTAGTASVDITTIFIAKRAGIKNPPQANDAPDSYPITAEDHNGEKAVGHAAVLRKVSAKPDKGTRGTMTTISGSGLPEGSTDVTIDDVDRPTAAHEIEVVVGADGSFELELDTALKDNNDKNVFSMGPNTINMSDARGKPANVSGTFTINPSFTISPESPIPGQIVTITLSDIVGAVTNASFAGKGIENAFKSDSALGSPDMKVKTVSPSGAITTYQIKMPRGVRIGSIEMRVNVVGASAPLKKTITIGTNALEVDPKTAVPGQQITITGSGFTANGSVAAADIKIDNRVVASENEVVDSTGNVNITVNLVEVADTPRTIMSGSREVEITDNLGRVGKATITVPKAEITLDPAEGPIGSMMTVSGTGFPANDLVLIQYGGTTVETANTSPTGAFTKEVTVPSKAEVGAKATVNVTSQVISGVSDTEEHKTPDPALSPATSATGYAGGSVTIGGLNFKGFVRVALIKIGGTEVTPVPAPLTDQWGAFTATDVRVPNLSNGTHPVEITVDEKSVTGFIQITDAVEEVSTDPADVFASLGDRLVRVWYLERSTQVWSFYDPDPDVAAFNTLTEVSSGQNVSIIISSGANIGFQDKTLYPGTNPIALD